MDIMYLYNVGMEMIIIRFVFEIFLQDTIFLVSLPDFQHIKLI